MHDAWEDTGASGFSGLLRLTESRAGERVCDPQGRFRYRARGKSFGASGFSGLLRLTEPRAEELDGRTARRAPHFQPRQRCRVAVCFAGF
jgi:hypothetical protein